MTSSVPAGAGGVDREAIRADLALVQRDMRGVTGDEHYAALDRLATLAVPALLDALEQFPPQIVQLARALAAAEQRADTAEAAIAKAVTIIDDWANDRDDRAKLVTLPTRVHTVLVAALSSRPVQPESEPR